MTRRQESTHTHVAGAAQPEVVPRLAVISAVVVAAIVSVGILGAITLLVVWLAERNKTGPEVALSLQFVAAAVLLILVICVLSIIFRLLGLDDRSRAMGLPEGSIRAIIALLLIVLFFLAAVFLFESTQERPDAGVRRTLQSITADRLAGISTDQILSLQSRTEGDTTVYDVDLAQAPTNTPESKDIAKQLITVVATLVTAVAAFYFGANSVGAAASRAYRETTLALNTPPGGGQANPSPAPTHGPDGTGTAESETGETETGETATAEEGAESPSTPSGQDDSAATDVAPLPDGDVPPLEIDEAVGDLEAEPVPQPLPDAPYVDDAEYDPANDAVDPDKRGESDEPDTPGAAGPPPDPSTQGEGQ